MIEYYVNEEWGTKETCDHFIIGNEIIYIGLLGITL